LPDGIRPFAFSSQKTGNAAKTSQTRPPKTVSQKVAPRWVPKFIILRLGSLNIVLVFDHHLFSKNLFRRQSLGQTTLLENLTAPANPTTDALAFSQQSVSFDNPGAAGGPQQTQSCMPKNAYK
jgi:hypothetical protein